MLRVYWLYILHLNIYISLIIISNFYLQAETMLGETEHNSSMKVMYVCYMFYGDKPRLENHYGTS